MKFVAILFISTASRAAFICAAQDADSGPGSTAAIARDVRRVVQRKRFHWLDVLLARHEQSGLETGAAPTASFILPARPALATPAPRKFIAIIFSPSSGASSKSRPRPTNLASLVHIQSPDICLAAMHVVQGKNTRQGDLFVMAAWNARSKQGQRTPTSPWRFSTTPWKIPLANGTSPKTICIRGKIDPSAHGWFMNKHHRVHCHLVIPEFKARARN